MTRDTQLTEFQYGTIAAHLERYAGIRLGPAKEYLVVSRLSGVLHEYDLADFEELARRLEQGASQALRTAVIDAMTTNETFWFRDPSHYEILVDVILPKQDRGPIRIWSAAASTGQEAYSIACALHEARSRDLPAARHDWEILGTDISPSALAQARRGRYCGASAARGLLPAQRRRFFVEDGDCLEVDPAIRRGVSFRDFNLLSSFHPLGQFDVIFCRNVLIYFSQERKRDILERFRRILRPGGALFIGSTESMSEHADLYRMERHGTGLVYFRD